MTLSHEEKEKDQVEISGKTVNIAQTNVKKKREKMKIIILRLKKITRTREMFGGYSDSRSVLCMRKGIL